MELETNDDFGELVCAEDWAAYVKCGAFIPYDGLGYWANDTEHCLQSDAFGPRPD